MIFRQQTESQCTSSIPNWDPNGWNSRNDVQDVAVVMGVIAALSVLGLTAAVVWWKKQSKKRWMPDSIALFNERDRQNDREAQEESYIYRRPETSGPSWFAAGQ
jgi:hypothetical protein